MTFMLKALCIMDNIYLLIEDNPVDSSSFLSSEQFENVTMNKEGEQV